MGSVCVLATTGIAPTIGWAIAIALVIVGGGLFLLARRRNSTGKSALFIVLAIIVVAGAITVPAATPASAACPAPAPPSPPAPADSVATISISDVTVTEDSGVADIVVTRTGPTSKAIVFDLATADGTAQTAGSGPGSNDYVGIDADHTFAASDTATESITVPVTINPDTIAEPDETFTVHATVTSGSVATTSVLDATVTITNDDAVPTVSVSDVSVNEGDGTANVVVTRTGGSVGDIVLHATTTDGTATSAGGGPGDLDYDSVDADFTIPASAGISSVTIPVTIIDDAVFEPTTEHFSLGLTPVAGSAAIDPMSDLDATVSVVDNDPPPTLTVNDVSVNEDTGQANLVITRAGATAQDVTFQLTTHDQSATTGAGIGGNDYVPTSNTHTISASANGTETIVVPIQINPDSVFESNEQFVVDLVPAAGTGTIASSSQLLATVTIVNDDAPPVLTVHDVSVNEDTGLANVQVTRTGATTDNITFRLSTSNGTAQSGSDYTAVNNVYTFPASNNGTESITVPIPITPDAVPEANETFTVDLTSVVGTISGSSDLQGTVTIINDDVGP